MIQDPFWLTDEQFSKIEPHLPTDTRGKARVPNADPSNPDQSLMGRLIPRLVDQDPWAQLRRPMDMIRQG